MRIGYSGDEDYPGQFNIWQANCERSLRGRKGQAALRELEAALLAMPEKRLIANELQNEQGDVCAIGALARHKGITPIADPTYEMDAVGVECGMPRLVAWKVVALNDIEIDWAYQTAHGPTKLHGPSHADFYEAGYKVAVPFTPEERYEKVLAWVRGYLKEAQ